jgi:hypothetical protein
MLRTIFSPSPLQAKYDLLQSRAADVLGDIRTVLLTASELIGGAYPAAAVRKSAVLALDLGFKLELRLRTLFAEHEAKQPGLPWRETLQPMRTQSQSLTRMSEILVERNSMSITNRFMRDMRVTA